MKILSLELCIRFLLFTVTMIPQMIGCGVGAEKTVANTPTPQTGPEWREVCPKTKPSGPGIPLQFSLKYESRESSKDSNYSRISAEFDGHLMTVYGPYGKCTRGRCDHTEVTFEPTTQELANLQEQLDRYKLWESFVEVNDTKFTGPNNTTAMELKLEDGKRTASSKVKLGRGFVADHKRIETGSKEALAHAEAVSAVIIQLKKNALRCFPDFETH